MWRPPRSILLDLLALSCMCSVSNAEVVDLATLPMPQGLTLSVHRVIFAKQVDATTVGFQDLVVTPSPGSEGNETLTKLLASEETVHVGLIPFNELWHFLDPNNFCGQSGLIVLAAAKDGAKPVLQGASATKKSQSVALPGTGTYALIIANCGDTGSIGLKGALAIKSPWGYLPFTHMKKLSFYAALGIACSGVALVWVLNSLRWWRQLFAFQKGLTFVAVITALEAGLWWGFHSTWNESGITDERLFWVAQMTSETKVVVAMASALCLTLLVEEVRPQTPCCDEADIVMPLKEHVFIVLFMVVELNRVINAHFRYIQVFKLSFVIANAVPAIVFGLVLWFRVFSRVSSTHAALAKSGGDEEQLILVSRVRGLMVLAAICGTAIATFQIFDPTMSTTDAALWEYHYIVSDALGQVACVFLLIAAMVIGMPRESLQPVGYAPTRQGDENTIGAPSIWDDDDPLDNVVGSE